MRNFKRSIICIVLALGACHDSTTVRPQRLDAINENSRDLITQEMPVSKTALRQALEQNHLTQRLRLVPVFTGPQGDEAIPYYRLFGITPESIYGQLGLLNADILIAADDRTLPNPDVFKQYVTLLPQVSEANVRIIREGKTLLFHYTMQE